MKEQDLAHDNLILKTITGSLLYGTNVEGSDVDWQGIFIPPKEYVYGLKKCEQVIVQEKLHDKKIDYTCYNLIKYVHLARQNNPNILSVLYTPQNSISFSDMFGKRLIEARSLFLSKKSYHTFRGYAHAQKHKLLTKTAEGKRLELIEKYGFDTKFAMHLLRLLYEALDIMVGGEIIYPCPHRTRLLDVRQGKVPINEILQEAEHVEKLVDEAYVRSDLQYQSNDKEIEKLQMEMLEDYWRFNDADCRTPEKRKE